MMLDLRVRGIELMAIKRSPLAPAAFPSLPVVPGVRLAAEACGVKYKGRTDVCLISLDPGSDGSRRLHHLEDGVGPRVLVPR